MISKNQKKYLRSLLHHKKVLIQIGQNGLTESVSKEIDLALEHHELIKIRIRNDDRVLRKKLAEQICIGNKAIMIQNIGSVYSIYRKNEEEPVIVLPG
jgi:RNA-binding protein